jgi:hypothetical protein
MTLKICMEKNEQHQHTDIPQSKIDKQTVWVNTSWTLFEK